MPLGPQNKDVVTWYGAMTFADHFFNLLRRREVTVRVVIHATLSCRAGGNGDVTRKRASELADEAVFSGPELKGVSSS